MSEQSYNEKTEIGSTDENPSIKDSSVDSKSAKNDRPTKKCSESCSPDCSNKAGRAKFKLDSAEKSMIKIGVAAFVLLVLAEAILYRGFFAGISDFDKYWSYIVYLTISVVFIGSAVWHIKHYRHMFDCSLGMMVGMTTGMMAGFMIGAIIGATNGMFVGSVAGMIFGMGIGAWCIRTCRIMPILEGLMAGLMSGLMGAMTTVMMVSDNITFFMPLLIGSCLLITGGMSYMVYDESKDDRKNIKSMDKYDMINYIAVMFIITIALTFLMVLGPKSAIAI